MSWLYRVLIASLLFVAGLALLANFRERAFIGHETDAILFVCTGALLDSIAIAVVTWPKIARRRYRSGPSNAELASRLDQIR